MEPLDLLVEIGRIMKRKGLKSYDTTVLDLENILIEEMNESLETARRLNVERCRIKGC